MADRPQRGSRPAAAASPSDSTRARRDLALALVLAALVPLVSAGHLAFAYLVQDGARSPVYVASLPILLLGTLLPGLVLILMLSRSRRWLEPRATDLVPRPASETTGQPGQPGESLHALLASERTDEV